MRIDGLMRYVDAEPLRVFTMLSAVEFQKLKCAATGAVSYDVEVHEVGQRTVVTCRRTMPTAGLPDYVRSLVGNGIKLIETLDWSGPGADGSRTAEVRVVFEGQPMAMTGRLTMDPSGNDTVCTLVADLRAQVPFIGGRIEKAAAPLIDKAIRTEQELGATWLQEHS